MSSDVDTRLEDALERVAHGAIISLPHLLFVKMLSFTTTTILTNQFGGSLYGTWILARKLVGFLRGPLSGFRTGLNRFLPTASNTEQDIFATVASILVLGPGMLLGVGLFLFAPQITRAFDLNHNFQLFLRIFAVWFPGSLWLQIINSILKGLEEVGAFNFIFRFVLPLADLAAVGIGAFYFHDFVVIVVGQVLIAALITLILTAWIMSRLEFIPQVRGVTAIDLQRKYLRYSSPLVGRRIVKTINNVGFYLLIPIFLSSIAAGVLAVGSLVSSVIRLPLVLNNQFMSPVVADLHDRGDHDALIRLYQITSRLILVGSTGLAIPLLMFRGTVMSLFGPTLVDYTSLLPLFLLRQFIAIVPGSDAIILQMTDRQRTVLVIDIITAILMVATAVPLTMFFGLRGLVVSYLVKATISNGLQVLALYHLNGFHPFTRLQLDPLIAAFPFLLITFAGKWFLSDGIAPLIGTLIGGAVYVSIIYIMGLDKVERRLMKSLLARYQHTLSRFTKLYSR